MSSQPSHCASPRPVHSVASLLHSRRMLPRARQASAALSTAAASGGGSAIVCAFTLSPSSASPFGGERAIELVERIGEQRDAVGGKFAGDGIERNAGAAERGEGRVGAAPTSSVKVSRTWPWSRNASMVGIGMVLTVSGPISSST